MGNRMFLPSLKVMTKRLMALLVSVVMLFGFTQAAALADSNSTGTESTPNLQIALAASSRFAAQAENDELGLEPTISDERLDEMREQRREWQSEVSANAYDVKDEADSSIGEVVKDKLNLDEITEENEIVDDLINR